MRSRELIPTGRFPRIYYFQAAIGSAECSLLLTSLPHFYESFLLDLPFASRAICPGACRRNIAGAVAGQLELPYDR